MTGKTILVADDETHILNVVSMKLRGAGYRVLTSEDGADAFALAESAHPDLIITDYQMPLLSGVELCAKLRCDPATRDIPAILLTARGFGVADGHPATGNIKRVVFKPFSPREVLHYVNDLLATPPGSCELESPPSDGTPEGRGGP